MNNNALTAAEQLREQILDNKVYKQQRRQRREGIIALKCHRRVAVGPYAIFHFENFDTMLYQIQEMLWIEKGGSEQLEDELAAYAPLVPDGTELVATLMLEIDSKPLRETALQQLGNIDKNIAIEVGGEKSTARPEHDVERTTEAGRTSSVHFLHFPFTPRQIEAMRDTASEACIAIEHPHYNYRAKLSSEQKKALAADLA